MSGLPRLKVVIASASFASVFMFLVAFRPPEAYDGLLVVPVLLLGRLGVRAGIIGAAVAVGLHSLVLWTAANALSGAEVSGHVLGTWLVFAAVGAVAGTMSTSPQEPDSSAKRAEANEIEALVEIGRIISSSLDVNEVYYRLSQQVRLLIRFDRMSVFVFDVAQGTTSTAYTTGVEMPGGEPAPPTSGKT